MNEPDICPAQEAWDVVSGKWKPCIIHVLSERPMRFNELLRHVPGVTQRMLTRQLRDLERDGIVSRRTAAASAHVEYDLTTLGRTILPVFVELTDWWTRHRERVEIARREYLD